MSWGWRAPVAGGATAAGTAGGAAKGAGLGGAGAALGGAGAGRTGGAAAPGWRPAASSCAASSSTRALRVASVEDRPSMRCMSVAVWRSPSDCCSRTRRSSWAVRVSSSALARWAFCWAWARSARSWKTSCFVASPVTSTELAQPPPTRSRARRRIPPPSSPEYRRTSAGLDQEGGAPVLGPARLALLGAQRSLLAVADDRDAVRLDALRHEVVHRGLRASLAERQIVLVGAALVTVPFDEDEPIRVRLEPRSVRVEHLCIVRPDVVPVEVEVDVLQVADRDELRGHRSRSARRAGRGGRAWRTRGRRRRGPFGRLHARPRIRACCQERDAPHGAHCHQAG